MAIVVRCAKVPTLALCAVLAPALAGGADWSEQQLATAGALRDRALSGTSAYEHVSSLVTEVGPRSAGSSGDAAAVRWALNKLASLGFSQVRTQDVLVPRWVRGHAEVTLAGPTPQSLVAVALGGSVGTSDEGVEAQVLEVASLDALNALPATTVGGKIVFINQRMERTRDGSGYGAAVRNRSEGPSAAGNLGAVALLIRSVGTSDQRHAHTGSIELSRRCAAHPGARAVESRRRSAGALAQTGQARTRAREVDVARAARDVVGERDRRDPGRRARQRDRAARRAPRLVGPRTGRDRRWRRRRDRHRSGATDRQAGTQAGAHGTRRAVRQRRVRPVRREGICAPRRRRSCAPRDRGRSGSWRRRGVADPVEGRAGCSTGSRRDPRGAEAARARSRQQRRARRLGSRPAARAGRADPRSVAGRDELLRRPPHDERHARADRCQDAEPGRRGIRGGRVHGGEQERRLRTSGAFP